MYIFRMLWLYIWSTFHPDFWVMNQPVSKVWDEKLNELMEQHKFIYISQYTAKLGPYTIWSCNYPFACFHPHDCSVLRPRRITILKAGLKYEKDTGRSIKQEKL